MKMVCCMIQVTPIRTGTVFTLSMHYMMLKRGIIPLISIMKKTVNYFRAGGCIPMEAPVPITTNGLRTGTMKPRIQMVME